MLAPLEQLKFSRPSRAHTHARVGDGFPEVANSATTVALPGLGMDTPRRRCPGN